MIRFWIVLCVCILTVLGRRIGRVQGRGWREQGGAGREVDSFETWLNHGNDAVVAADKETLRHIEHEIDKLEKAEAEVVGDIKRRLEYEPADMKRRLEEVDDEDLQHYLGEEGSGQRMYYNYM